MPCPGPLHIGLLLFFTISSVLAQFEAAPLAARASEGLGGIMRRDRHFPLTIQLRNRAGPVAGTLRMTGGEDHSIWEQPFELGAKATKDYQFLLAYQGHYTLRFLDLEGHEIQDALPVSPAITLEEPGLAGLYVAHEDRRVVPEVLRRLFESAGSGSPLFQVAAVSAANLPSHWLGLEAMDFIVLGEEELEDVPPAVFRALDQWVVRGGRLIAIGGERAFRFRGTPILEWLPVSFGEESVELVAAPSLERLARVATGAGGAAGPVGVPRATLADGAEALAAEQGVVVAARRHRGDGEVIYVAWDPSRGAPVAPGVEAEIWRALVTPGVEADGGSDRSGYNREGAFHPTGLSSLAIWGALNPMDQTSFPFLTVLGLAVIYVLVLGPGQSFLLGRRKAHHLAWITTPILAILFSAGAFYAGYRRHGGQAYSTEIRVLATREGADRAKVDVLSRVFAAFEDRFDLRLDAEQTATRMVDGPVAGSGSPRGSQSMKMDGNSLYPAGAEISMWSNRTAWSRTTTEMDAPVKSSFEVVGQRVTGSLTNVSGRDLRHPTLVHDGKYTALPPLPAGTEVPFDVHLTNDVQESYYVSMESMADLEKNRSFWSTLGRARRDGKFWVVAFCDAPEAPAFETSPPVISKKRLGVLLCELTGGEGKEMEFVISPRMVTFRHGSSAYVRADGLPIPSTPLEIEARLFRFPREGTSIRSMRILDNDQGSSYVVSLYNRETSAWDAISGYTYHYGNNVPAHELIAADEYLEGPHGAVRLRVERKDPGTQAMINGLGISAEGYGPP